MDGGRLEVPPVDRLPGGADTTAFAASGGLASYLQLLGQCWAQEPSERPGFDEIARQLG